MITSSMRRTMLAPGAALSLPRATSAVAAPAGATVSQRAAAAQESVALHQAVAALPVAAEDRTGYNRESGFGGWIDADHDGCNTRQEVLLDEAVIAPTVTGTCTLTGGTCGPGTTTPRSPVPAPSISITWYLHPRRYDVAIKQLIASAVYR